MSALVESCSKRLWRALDGSKPEFEFARVPERERILFVAHWLIADVVNGGFAGYFASTDGGLAPEAADACEALGLSPLARITRRAIQKLGPIYSRKRQERVRVLRALARAHPRPDLEFEGVVSPLEAALEGLFEREERAFFAVTNEPARITRAFSEFAARGEARSSSSSPRSSHGARRAEAAIRGSSTTPKKPQGAGRRPKRTRIRAARTK